MSSSSKKKNLAKKTGWLEKKGDKGPVKIWRLRYFVETEKGTVQYFTSTDLNQDTYRGQIDLHDVLSVSKSIEVDVTQSEQNKLEFNVLVKSGRIYRMRVDTQEERKQWMTVFGSKLLRAREQQQQRPIPATTPATDPKQNFNNFDFHAHTMPAYVMKQLYEESQQQQTQQGSSPEKHPGSKLERSHSAENPRTVLTVGNSPYGKLSAAPIIVDLTATPKEANGKQPNSYGLMPKPETLRAMREQQRTSQQLSQFKDSYLHLIQHEPEKYLHVTNQPNAPPTSYARLSKYNLESSTNYDQSPRMVDHNRPSGMAMEQNELEYQRLEKLLMEEESRGSIYGKPMQSFMQEDEPFTNEEVEQQPVLTTSEQDKKPAAEKPKPEDSSPRKTYNYGSLAAVSAMLDEKDRAEANSTPVSHHQGGLKSNPNRRSSIDMYQAIPSKIPVEEKKERSVTESPRKDREPEYGCLPAVRKSQLPPEVLQMLESNKRQNTPPTSPSKPASTTPTTPNRITLASDQPSTSPQRQVDPAYLQLPSYETYLNSQSSQ